MKRFRILLLTLVLILGSVLFSSAQAVSLKAQKERPFSDDYFNLDTEHAVAGNGVVNDDVYTFLKGFGDPQLSRGYTVFKIYKEGDTDYSETYYLMINF